MVRGYIKVAPEIGIGRDGQQQNASGKEERAHFAQDTFVVGQVFQNIEQTYQIERFSKRGSVRVTNHERTTGTVTCKLQSFSEVVQPDHKTATAALLEHLQHRPSATSDL